MYIYEQSVDGLLAFVVTPPKHLNKYRGAEPAEWMCLYNDAVMILPSYHAIIASYRHVYCVVEICCNNPFCGSTDPHWPVYFYESRVPPFNSVPECLCMPRKLTVVHLQLQVGSRLFGRMFMNEHRARHIWTVPDLDCRSHSYMQYIVCKVIQ